MHPPLPLLRAMAVAGAELPVGVESAAPSEPARPELAAVYQPSKQDVVWCVHVLVCARMDKPPPVKTARELAPVDFALSQPG
jgi:hypothetical protein